MGFFLPVFSSGGYSVAGAESLIYQDEWASQTNDSIFLKGIITPSDTNI